MFLITTSALPCCSLATWTEKNFAQMNIPQVRRVRKQDHQHTDSHINQTASLNAPSDPAQSPHHSEPKAWFCRCIHVEDPCTRQLKLLTLTWIHTPSKFFTNGREWKLLAGLRPNRLFGMFIGSFAVLTQMEEPDCALPFHTWGTRGRKMFAVISTVLFSSWEAMNVLNLPLWKHKVIFKLGRKKPSCMDFSQQAT